MVYCVHFSSDKISLPHKYCSSSLSPVFLLVLLDKSYLSCHPMWRVQQPNNAHVLPNQQPGQRSEARPLSPAGAASAGAAHQSHGLARQRSAQGADPCSLPVEARQHPGILHCCGCGPFIFGTLAASFAFNWPFVESSFKEEER